VPEVVISGAEGEEMIVNFPDWMPPEEIKAALDKKFSQVREFMSHVWGNMSVLDKAAVGTMFVPVVGDVTGLAADIDMYVTDPESRTFLNGVFTAAGVLPLIPAASQMKKAADALDMGQEARMARAREMGFDVNTPMYRGTTATNEISASHSFEAGKGVFTTDNPDVAEIFRYPREWGEVQTEFYDDVAGEYVDIEPGDMQELFVNKGRTISPPDPQRFTDDTAYQINFINKAKNSGYDSITIPNVNEGVGEWVEQGTTVVVLDPSNIRSVNAAFDPAKKDSANLLAEIAGAGVLTGAVAANRNKDDDSI